jgi:hypothetical protein
LEEDSEPWMQQGFREEEMDADDYDSEEAKIAFLAARAKELALYRKLARTRPEDVVLINLQLSLLLLAVGYKLRAWYDSVATCNCIKCEYLD